MNNYISREELTNFIGNNSNYYLKYIFKFENKSTFLSWNWSCFFLASYWLLYRKLYLPAFILIAIDFSASKLLSKTSTSIFILLIHIILTLFGNSIYFNHCGKKIKQIRTNITNLSAAQYVKNLHQKGSVSLLGPVLLLIIHILVSIAYIVIWFSSMSNIPNPGSHSYYF